MNSIAYYAIRIFGLIGAIGWIHNIFNVFNGGDSGVYFFLMAAGIPVVPLGMIMGIIDFLYMIR